MVAAGGVGVLPVVFEVGLDKVVLKLYAGAFTFLVHGN